MRNRWGGTMEVETLPAASSSEKRRRCHSLGRQAEVFFAAYGIGQGDDHQAAPGDLRQGQNRPGESVTMANDIISASLTYNIQH